MTILRDPYGNKIQRNASGEVLKQPPIIDISSDFGVTKDGSNLVSKVKNRYQPNVFRAPSGQEPIENGNGFEFSGNPIRPYIIGTGFDFNQDFTIEFWFKKNTDTTFRVMAQGLDTQGLFRLRHASSNLYLEIYGNYTQGTQLNAPNNIIDIPTDTWVHYIGCKIGANTSDYIDGVVNTSYKNVPTAIINSMFLTIGTSLNYVVECLDGSLESIKVSRQTYKKLLNYNPDTTGMLYPAFTQVFTPPTYPKTLL